MKVKIFNITFILLITKFNIFSQDIHFSQSHLSPINLNPAETGNYLEDFRLHINQRTQWRSITVPYVTFSSSFEVNWKELKIPGKVSNGIIFNTDKAGDGNFGTNQIGLAISYKIPNNDTNLVIRIGTIFMWNQHSVDYTKFYFDNQYNGYIFDPTLPSNEVFPKSNLSYFDFHTGVLITKTFNSIPVNLGLSLYHINAPKKSFYNEVNVNLDRKFSLYLNSNLKLWQRTFLIPNFYWFKQRMLKEVYIGGLINIKTQNTDFKGYYIGGWFRLGDAAIISAAFDYKNIHISFSYDYNISPLVAASNGRGGLEIGIKYLFSKSQKIIIPEKHVCPTFL